MAFIGQTNVSPGLYSCPSEFVGGRIERKITGKGLSIFYPRIKKKAVDALLAFPKKYCEEVSYVQFLMMKSGLEEKAAAVLLEKKNLRVVDRTCKTSVMLRNLEAY